MGSNTKLKGNMLFRTLIQAKQNERKIVNSYQVVSQVGQSLATQM